MHWLSAVIFCTFIVGQSQTKPATPDFKLIPRKLDVAENATIVLLGDSITHQCLYTQYFEDYIYTRYPKFKMRIHNAGIGGDRCSDALVRFDEDVAKYKPKYVSILLGMNDGSYRAYDQKVFETYQRDMTKLIEKIQSIGATPILMTPTMYDHRAAQIKNGAGNLYYNGTLAYFGAFLRETAQANGFRFVDMYGPLNTITLAQRRSNAKFTLIQDAVHPEGAGQAVMAAAMVDDIFGASPLSEIAITLTGQGPQPASKTTGGTLADLSHSAGKSVAFSFQADSLPWVLPSEGQVGIRLGGQPNRYNRGMLKISGLQPGAYEILIDGVSLSTHSAGEFANGVNVYANGKHPDYKPATAVAELNRNRNTQAVNPMRNFWIGPKMLRGLEAKVKANKANEQEQKRFASLTEQMKTFDKTAVEYADRCRNLELQIYQQAQPKSHKFEIVRVVAKPLPVQPELKKQAN